MGRHEISERPPYAGLGGQPPEDVVEVAVRVRLSGKEPTVEQQIHHLLGSLAKLVERCPSLETRAVAEQVGQCLVSQRRARLRPHVADGLLEGTETLLFQKQGQGCHAGLGQRSQIEKRVPIGLSR